MKMQFRIALSVYIVQACKKNFRRGGNTKNYIFALSLREVKSEVLCKITKKFVNVRYSLEGVNSPPPPLYATDILHMLLHNLKKVKIKKA